MFHKAATERFPLVGKFGALFEHFEAAAARWPDSVKSSFAILRVHVDEPFKVEFLCSVSMYLCIMHLYVHI